MLHPALLIIFLVGSTIGEKIFDTSSSKVTSSQQSITHVTNPIVKAVSQSDATAIKHDVHLALNCIAQAAYKKAYDVSLLMKQNLTTKNVSIIGFGVLYSYIFIQLLQDKYYVTAHSCWGHFIEQVPTEDFSPVATDAFNQRLYKALQRVYTKDSSALFQITSLLNDIQREIQHLHSFISKREILKNLSLDSMLPCGSSELIKKAQVRRDKLRLLQQFINSNILHNNKLFAQRR